MAEVAIETLLAELTPKSREQLGEVLFLMARSRFTGRIVLDCIDGGVRDWRVESSGPNLVRLLTTGEGRP